MVVVALVGASALAAWGAGLKIELPLETGLFEPGEHSEIANAQCLVCHSSEYVTTQPPMPRAFWKASVEKMQQKYGAPISAGQAELLVEYLAKYYGAASNTTTNPAPQTEPATVPPRPDAPLLLDGAKVAVKYGCLACHNEKVKLVGPALNQIASKYRDDTGFREKIALQVTRGGSGQWGSIPMPPFPKIPESEVKAVAEWILSLK